MSDTQEETSHIGSTSQDTNEHGADSKQHAGRPRHGTDVDAQEMIIASLREQVQDLFSQVSQLNNKLVQSYDRVSNLEDDVHVASSNLRASSVKISQLEMERAQHLAALNTGLLVEKTHVTAELSRLMEKATEEAAQRGQAESARAAIEKDLDDLSATLFDQANTMVAEARFARSLSERKVEDAERALKGAEEAVSMMQQQMQSLQAEKEIAEKQAEEMQILMRKGKWVEKQEPSAEHISRTLRLLNTHSPYQEFLLFVGHLRSLHTTSATSPVMPTLLQLPFLARLSTEDSEPTVRLDLAPSLNWLSRRSVLSAIHGGQLRIEPISSVALIAEATSFGTSTTIAGLNGGIERLPCALCGSPVFPTDASSKSNTLPNPFSGLTHSHSWSSSIFKKATGPGSQPTTPPRSPTFNSQLQTGHPQQIHIFRLASPQTSSVSSTISSIPLPSLSKPSSHTSTGGISHHPSPSISPPTTTIYPLCSSGWCLTRLRTTCCLWAFVRSGIVERIWEEEISAPLRPPTPTVTSIPAAEKPPVPPRKRGLWGIASVISEKAASWGDSDKKSDKVAKDEKTHVKEERRLPPPPAHRPVPVPPVHQPISGSTNNLPAPPIHPSIAGPTHNPPAPTHQPQPSTPPPLPKRSQGRRQVASPAPPDTPTKAVDEETPKLSASDPAGSKLGATPYPPSLPPRANTPANVPLPDSRPASPANVPDRTGSPAAPPPIPRRAAARGSRTIVPGSRPGTPNPSGLKEQVKSPESSEKNSEPSEKPVESSGKASDNLDVGKQSELGDESEGNFTQVTPKGSQEAISESSPPTEKEISSASSSASLGPSHPEVAVSGAEIVQPSRPALMSQVSGSSDEVFEDAPAPADEPKEPVDSVSPKPVDVVIDGSTEAELKTPTDTKDLSDHQKSEGVHVNGVDSLKDAGPDQVSKEEFGVIDEVKKPEEIRALKVNGSADDQKEAEDNEDAKNYVGDITWEDRTWKELVRLREDMFWARIGGLR